MSRILILRPRIDGLVPNTPGTGKLSKAGSARKRQLDSPSISRVKNGIASSSPDYKSSPAIKLEEQMNNMGAIP